jgi:hypothetical protein
MELKVIGRIRDEVGRPFTTSAMVIVFAVGGLVACSNSAVTVAMMNSTPTMRAVVLSANIGEGDMNRYYRLAIATTVRFGRGRAVVSPHRPASRAARPPTKRSSTSASGTVLNTGPDTAPLTGVGYITLEAAKVSTRP